MGDTRRYVVTQPAGNADNLTQIVDSQATLSTGETVFNLTTRDGTGAVRRVDVNGHADSGMLWAGSDESTIGSFRMTPPVATPTGLVPGQAVTFRSDATGTGALATVRFVSGVSRFVGLETVTVPAGTFNGCVHLALETEFTDAAGNVLVRRSGNTYLAPGIGPVKVEIDGGNTYELTSAQVGDRTIP